MGSSLRSSNPTLPPGNYRVLSTSIRLVVPRCADPTVGASLVFQIAGQPRMYFSMPMEGIAEPLEEAGLAMQVREQIVYFLAAAYDPPGPREWMEEIEQDESKDGLLEWLWYWNREQEILDRTRIRKEYEQWLQTDRS